jgi:hypothetical protein
MVAEEEGRWCRRVGVVEGMRESEVERKKGDELGLVREWPQG